MKRKALSNEPSSFGIYAGLLCYFMNLLSPKVFSTQQRVYFVMVGIPSVACMCFAWIILFHKEGLLYYTAIVGSTVIFLLIAMYFSLGYPLVKMLRKNRLEAHAAAKDVFSEGSDSGNIVSHDDFDAYLPATTATVGLVMIPGALVSRDVYAVVATALAQEGILVVIPSTGLIRLPSKVYGFTAKWLETLLENVETSCNTKIEKWSIGGHSMGAQLAAELIQDFPKLQKLVLWGVYRLHQVDLASSGNDVLLVTASNDGFFFKSKEAEESLLSRLPPLISEGIPKEKCTSGLVWINILGGNHSGFGTYGPQVYPAPDGERKISLEEQHGQIVSSTAKFLKS